LPPVKRSILSSSRAWLWLGLCAAILLPRAYGAICDQGMIWADEIFQTLEQGHRLVFGYGLVPWEFKVGARSWLLPGLIGGVMKLLSLLGVVSAVSMVIWVKLIFAGLAFATFYPMLRMAQAWGGVFALVLMGVVASVFPASLIYGSRAMAEVASAPFLAWGLWLLWPWGMGQTGKAAVYAVRPVLGGRGNGVRGLVGAGALLGLATVLRYQSGILLPVILVVVAARRSLRAAAWVAAGITVILLLGGILDWATWGRPFQSLIVYLRFNLVEGGASQWGIAKRGFYLRVLLSADGPAVLILLLGFVAGLRRTWPVALPALFFFCVHTAISHKELRFLYPVLPMFLLCAAVGLAGLLSRLPFPRARRRAATAALALVLLVAFAARARSVTFADIGQLMDAYGYGGPTSSLVWRAFDERNRLFEQAGTHADICGLAAPTMNPYWTGGYSYLHRPVPILWTGGRADFDAANYVLLGPGQRMNDPRYRSLSKEGAYVLYRRDGACKKPTWGSAGFGRLTPMGVPGT
jgi:phosphatidylinositol glycan class B